jgi:hypothetical protein
MSFLKTLMRRDFLKGLAACVLAPMGFKGYEWGATHRVAAARCYIIAKGPRKVVSVSMPVAIHDRLKAEAKAKNTSVSNLVAVYLCTKEHVS